MKKFIIIFFTCILLIFTTKTALATEAPNIIVLKGTNEIKDGFPVYADGGDTKVPIIMLSAKREDNDKILGIITDADDYVTKPFNPLELVLRLLKFHKTMK